MDAATLGGLNRLLVGKSCTGMENLGSYLQLLLGPCRLVVSASWRVVRGGEFLIGSGDEDVLIMKQMPGILLGRLVQSVEITGRFHDLTISFTGDTFLEVYADAVTYESWNIVNIPPSAGIGSMIVAGPGSSLAVF